ncbi:MAG: hypothetical protein OXC40_05355 [Proteobacteria bacterium]|nr:hypothetical protein [Pseudomonadota bacterium]
MLLNISLILLSSIRVGGLCDFDFRKTKKFAEIPVDLAVTLIVKKYHILRVKKTVPSLAAWNHRLFYHQL